MSDNYQVVLGDVVPGKGRARPKLRLRVTQDHTDACHLRALKHDRTGRLQRFAGRLLADSGIPAFAVKAAWEDDARFPFLAKSQAVTVVEFISHDLIALMNHDRAALRELAKRAHREDWDLDAYRAVYGPTPYESGTAADPFVHDEPAHYSNFCDEALIEVRLSVEVPVACVAGMRWGSAAFG